MKEQSSPRAWSLVVSKVFLRSVFVLSPEILLLCCSHCESLGRAVPLLQLAFL